MWLSLVRVCGACAHLPATELIFKSIMDEKLKASMSALAHLCHSPVRQFPEEVPVSKEAKKMMRALLTPDVKKRLGSQNGASDLKSHPFFAGINWALVRDMKPPIMPRVDLASADPHKRSQSKDERPTEPVAEVVPEAGDAFKEFRSVSKREMPTERQLQAEEETNTANDFVGSPM